MSTEASNVIHAFICATNAFAAQPVFRRLIVAIIGDLRINQVITETDVYATTDNGKLVYTPNASTIISLCHITSLFTQLLAHATHHTPFGTIACPLEIPRAQASELKLDSEDALSLVELRQRANDLVHLYDASRDEVLRELRKFLEELSIRFAWLEERIENSASLGFESTINWGAWFGWSWSQFLVTYYPQLLTHYSSEDGYALSTHVAPMNAIVPYDPRMPAFDIDLSATQSSFELADSISNATTRSYGYTINNKDRRRGNSRMDGPLSPKSIGQWWPTILVEEDRVLLILYNDKGIEVRRKVIDWKELMENNASFTYLFTTTRK
ncbi:hypothetical protein IW261DRAFT_1425305 [Armillaria novae-zelandiae]|uniref:Uncharacterized protein n=1 Tax=Armillaria novae-zelandiae TaxID=153914 RepID=A0AA39NT09_9AGAR|nr:hypothetical protein IW261DRAFT_1425305 [Armillaria novae-zelandiae]